MTNTIIGLLRHGQTDWNVEMRLQGTSDIPLNATGKAQAAAVVEHLNAAQWQAITSSPLSRAVETATTIATGLNRPLLPPMDALTERSFGLGEGLTYEHWRQLVATHTEVPDSESLQALADRCWQLLDLLKTDFAGQRVLAVSHGAMIRKIIELVSDGKYPLQNDRFGNTSLSVIRHTDETGWEILRYLPHTYTGENLGF